LVTGESKKEQERNKRVKERERREEVEGEKEKGLKGPQPLALGYHSHQL
jgi:hypothetical protein